MRTISFVFSLFLFATLVSCERCQVCEAKDQDNVVRHTYTEVCGSKADVEEYAKNCANEYGAFDGFVCSCTETN
jgi:hypothetical protein